MCGIVGIVNQQPVAHDLYDSLIQLQHRGQAAAGMVTVANQLHRKLGAGLVREVFAGDDLARLTGKMGLAHVRYPTHGDSDAIEEIQPFCCEQPYHMAMAHNGNLINYQELKALLQQQFQRTLNTDSDSEALLNLISVYLAEALQESTDTDFFTHASAAVSKILATVKGSYATVCVVEGKGMLAFRDPHGVRPLVMGQRGQSEFIIASENAPFFALGFTFLGDVQPGELVFISLSGKVQRKLLVQRQAHPCVFEYIYFARPDAVLDNVSVYRMRASLGVMLAKLWQQQHPGVIPDVVIPVPCSANTAAWNFAARLGVSYSEGLHHNSFIGRTFIMSDEPTRQRAVRHKLIPQATAIKGKAVLLLDDSIVRGTTGREIVQMMREAGARRVYLVSTAPELRFPCYYGINIPTADELIASKLDHDELTKHFGVDLLLYQRQEDLLKTIVECGSKPVASPCMACMTQHYPCGKPAQEVTAHSSSSRVHPFSGLDRSSSRDLTAGSSKNSITCE